MTWDGDDYQARFDSLAARGVDVHGEVAFLLGLDPVPKSILDAGCGTGRVAIELARRGVAVVRSRCGPRRCSPPPARPHPISTGSEHDLATLDLGRQFEVVVMAGNVPLFTPRRNARGDRGRVRPPRRGPAARSWPGSNSLGATQLEQYDEHCAAAGLTLAERFAGWAREPFIADGDYAVSVHRL